jgi:hypothetical protein
MPKAHVPHLLRHLARAERQARGDDSGQALRDSGHGQRHRYLEVVGALAEREGDRGPDGKPVVASLPRHKVRVVDGPHEDADDRDDLRSGTTGRLTLSETSGRQLVGG